MAHHLAAEMISMKYRDLRDFLSLLEQRGELKRISQPIDPYLEMTEIADRTLRAGGPALLLKIEGIQHARAVQPVWYGQTRGNGDGARRC